jgi:C4-dicarboxylate transporter, DctM subunit
MSKNRVLAVLRKTENGFSIATLILLAIFPIVEIIMRKVFTSGVPGSSAYIQHLVVWATFFGGMITSRQNDHLALTAGFGVLPERFRRWVSAALSLIAVTVGMVLSWSALSFILMGYDPQATVGVVPVRLAVAVIPLGYFVMTLRFIVSKNVEHKDRWLPALGIVIGTLIAIDPVINILFLIFPNIPEFFFAISDFFYNASHLLRWPVFAVLIVAVLLGAPLFVIIGGIGILLFSQSGGSLEVIPNEAYSMLISSSIPAIPLFTLAGFVLSESGAGKRLVRLFRAFFGWLPGGLTIATVIVCAFFTTFTGASGVTILALGALLSYVLIENGSKKNFTHGLVTASGSIGLLFPPSLPIILYGVVAQTNIKHMFLGGIIPGAIMVVTLSAMGVYTAVRNKLPRTPFRTREAIEATRGSAGELLLPVIIIVGYFTGIMTIVEAAAVSVLYTIILAVFIHRDIKLRDLPGTAMKAVPIIGGVLIILTVARGLSYYIVDAEVPFKMSMWVEQHISSKYVFLILLNIALLVTGCLMDIFSAIVVVAPLIIPLGEIFGIHPVHLGVIFLANLELGYLTPPVGLNLFLASYRFKEPLAKVYKNVIPFFVALLITVLLITYVPWFSTVLIPKGG